MSLNDETPLRETEIRSGGIPLPMAPLPEVRGGVPSHGGDDPDAQAGPDRRTVLKWMALAAAAPAVGGCADGEIGPSAGTAGSTAMGGSAAGVRPGVGNPKAAGTPWDPDLIAPQRHWDLVLSEDERQGLAVLCDVIIPADDVSPAASTVGAVEYIDEWVSAPYDGQRADLVLVRGGLVWLDREAETRFGDGRRFRDLTDAEKTAICDDICWIRRAAPEHRMAARFFAKIRDLTATAFYTTHEGMADIGYVGNTALARWEAPPTEVLRHLGLA
jgi:hypothetical protein